MSKATDSLGRRSRFIRNPTGKTLVLGQRDLEVLIWLYRYRYLRIVQLIAFIKPQSHKRFVERLGDLFHETGLINRPPCQWQGVDPKTTPTVYEITQKGLRYLELHGTVPHRATSLGRRVRTDRTPQFAHAMMIVDAIAKVELETRAVPGQRFVSVDEILARAPESTRKKTRPLEIPVTLYPCKELPWLKKPLQTHVVPDGLYGIEYLIDGEKRYRFWALECERESPVRRRTKALSSTELKQAAYKVLIKSAIYKEHWKIPNLWPLFKNEYISMTMGLGV
jgi:Replication-relaxation